MVVRLIRKEEAGDDIIPWVPATLPVGGSLSHAINKSINKPELSEAASESEKEEVQHQPDAHPY